MKKIMTTALGILIVAMLAGCPQPPEPPEPPKKPEAPKKAEKPEEPPPPKKPDETPEEALARLVEFRDKKHEMGLYGGWLLAMQEVERWADFCITSRWAEEQKNSRGINQLVENAWPGPGAKAGVFRTTTNPDGTVLLETVNFWWHGEVCPQILLEKVGTTWKVREVTTQCPACKGSGKHDCGWSAMGIPCSVCHGTKKCPRCNGEGRPKRSLARIKSLVETWGHRAWDFADREPAYSKDISTPSSCARAYCDFLVRQQLALSQRDLAIMKQAVAELKDWVAPERLAEYEREIESMARKGARRFESPLCDVEVVREEGERAAVRILMSGKFDFAFRGKRVYLQLKKSADGWRVDGAEVD